MGQVAIYCRVSTDDQSCDRQERVLGAFDQVGVELLLSAASTRPSIRSRPSSLRSTLAPRRFSRHTGLDGAGRWKPSVFNVGSPWMQSLR
jgi:hypothetical protein